jgi:hypothetical protein
MYASKMKVMPVFVPHCVSPTRIAEGMLQVIASVCVPSSCATHSNLARVTTPRVAGFLRLRLAHKVRVG